MRHLVRIYPNICSFENWLEIVNTIVIKMEKTTIEVFNFFLQ